MALIINGTDYVQLPVGTTAQRPALPATGMMRVNSTTNSIEIYTGTEWVVAVQW